MTTHQARGWRVDRGDAAGRATSSTATRAGTRSSCRTWRGASARRPPLPDLPRARSAGLRARSSSPFTTSPSCATRRRSTSGRGSTAACAVSRVVRAARLVIAVSEFTKRELVELLATPPESRSASSRTAVADGLHAGRARPRGDYVLAVGTLEPRKNLARLRRGDPAARRRATRRRRARLGRRPARGRRRALARPSLRRGARRALPRRPLPRLPVARTRASGSRCSRRWPAARRSSRSRGGATEEVAGGAAVLVDPLDPASIAAGIEEAVARRDELVRRGPRARPRVHLGRRPRADTARSTGRRPRDAPLVVIDADVLGRQRTGDETYVENLLARLPGARRRTSSASRR